MHPTDAIGRSRRLWNPQNPADKGREPKGIMHLSPGKGVPSVSGRSTVRVRIAHLLDEDVGGVAGLIRAKQAGDHPPRARHRATLRRLAPVAVVPADRHGASRSGRPCGVPLRASSPRHRDLMEGTWKNPPREIRVPNRAPTDRHRRFFCVSSVRVVRRLKKWRLIYPSVRVKTQTEDDSLASSIARWGPRRAVVSAPRARTR